MPDVHAIETPTHGRVLVEHAAISLPAGWLIGFHGYGQLAEDALADLARIPGADAWHRVGVQALHRFYTRGDQKVVASWMTRQDRELAIADNIEYVNRAIAQIVPAGANRIVFVGFSQGVAMAYRAAVRGRHTAAGVIAVGGDIPPELKSGADAWPPVFIGAGDGETWFTADKAAADESFLSARRIAHEVFRYRGGHEWTEELCARMAQWLAGVA